MTTPATAPSSRPCTSPPARVGWAQGSIQGREGHAAPALRVEPMRLTLDTTPLAGGATMRMARGALNVPACELARVLEISDSLLHRIERGDRQLGFERWRQAMEHMGGVVVVRFERWP